MIKMASMKERLMNLRFEEEQDKFCKEKKVKCGKCFAHTFQLPIVRVSKSKKTTFEKTLKKKHFVAKVTKSTKAKYFLEE